MNLSNRPLPAITEDNEVFWASARERALKLQQCGSCGRFRYYPSPFCHYCSSGEFSWEPISGDGTVYSYSVLERAKGNPYEQDVPIAIVLVRLAEGPVMMSNLIDYQPEHLRVDQPVVLAYGDVDDTVTLPLFRPVS